MTDFEITIDDLVNALSSMDVDTLSDADLDKLFNSLDLYAIKSAALCSDSDEQYESTLAEIRDQLKGSALLRSFDDR